MLTYEHVRRLGLDKKSNVFEVEPRLATMAELAAVHDPDYVEIVERTEAGDVPALAGLE